MIRSQTLKRNGPRELLKSQKGLKDMFNSPIQSAWLQRGYTESGALSTSPAPNNYSRKSSGRFRCNRYIN